MPAAPDANDYPPIEFGNLAYDLVDNSSNSFPATRLVINTGIANGEEMTSDDYWESLQLKGDVDVLKAERRALLWMILESKNWKDIVYAVEKWRELKIRAEDIRAEREARHEQEEEKKIEKKEAEEKKRASDSLFELFVLDLITRAAQEIVGSVLVIKSKAGDKQPSANGRASRLKTLLSSLVPTIKDNKGNKATPADDYHHLTT
ncbi:MAG: hypothetical protein P4M13_05480 [Alphaproteobacteria bacterium]|nr:hypothetical protein [Alphaproteobacteria bacterium]